MTRLFRFPILLLLFVPVYGQQGSQTPSVGNGPSVIPAEKRRPIPIPKLSPPAAIDGKLDEEVWESAAVFKDFYQTSPGYNIAPSEHTEAYIFYDEQALFIGFKCWDDPEKIRSTVAARDAISDQDNVTVWLDTFADHRRAYVLAFNPLGIQQDGIFVEGQGTDLSVDILMESKGAVFDWGWSVEVRIPFKSLRYRAGPGRTWGINVARSIHRLNQENDQWMPDDRNVSGTLIKHGRLTGLDGIRAGRTLSVVASTTVSETGKRVSTIPPSLLTPSSVDPGAFVNRPVRAQLGATIKYTITPDLTFDMAINPDFADVEADAPVATANERFPIFYAEKRPFFLEGLDILTTPNQLFHSRTIIAPVLAAKLTGKVGKTSLGLLFAIDKGAGIFNDEELSDPSRLASIQEFVNKKAYVGVLRLKRDVGAEDSIGVFGSIRSFPERHNAVFGFDGKFKLSPKLIANFSAVGTMSRSCFFEPYFDPLAHAAQAARNREICGTGTFDPNEPVDVLNDNLSTYSSYRTGKGLGYIANLDYSARNAGWTINASGVSTDYLTDVGYTRRSNRNSFYVSHRRNTEPKPKAPLIRLNWSQSGEIDYDWAGRLQNINAYSDIDFTFQRNTVFAIETGVFFEAIHEDEFGLARLPGRTGAFLGRPRLTAWQPKMAASLDSAPFKRLNFEIQAGFLGNAFDYDLDHYPHDPKPGLWTGFEVQVGYRPIDSLNIDLRYNREKIRLNDTGRLAYDSNIASVRSTYQFTRFTFARFRVDYDSIARSVAGQALFGWNPNPGTSIYAGYNDNLRYNGFSPFTGQYEPRFVRNDRTFFVKLSYLFQKRF